ncbi:unnamed protein product [Lepeophtheirus salmonis]|uniref:(salmon louse) hypothetical protein n=1 Tax=Lepeophtheirus salmonis TaxID=72036 RepID=A0A7R8CVA8_LEPSM|nr:unnamed protein product [Lepeophtheirus salmonis]CAF2910055.1 unnamed protein product [Lepeophtheirus salmonis]
MEKVNNNSSPRPEKIFDAHIHFWDLKKRREYVPQNPSFDWPNNSTPGIFKNYLPQDYSHVPFHDAIFVQALNQCPQEIEWTQELCKSSAPFIKGIVGGLDFTKPDNILEYISMYRKGKCPLIGLRHILDADKDPQGFFEREDVLKSLELIDRSNLDMTVDLVLRPHNLYIASNLASKYPSIRFMIDHIAKPQMSSDGLSSRHETWMREMKKVLIIVMSMQRYPVLLMKLTRIKRFVFGSDWPVSIDSSYEYDDVIRLADGLLSHLSVSEREDIFYNNGIGFYGIKDL